MENSNSLLKHFILMVGIPASGKSTLSKALRDNLNDCTLIEFDKIEENLASTSKSDSFDPEIWHKARDLAFQQARDTKTKFVILDDNFSHRSMRKPYYQMARESSSSYIELRLSISIEEALLRNSQRSKPVPEEVIKNMKIEDPSHPTHSIDATCLGMNDLLSLITVPMIPKPLIVNVIEEQQFLDKVDQALKKTFASFMTQLTNKSKAKFLNEKRAEFYQHVKTTLNKLETQKDSNNAISEILLSYIENEFTESKLIDQLCNLFLESLKTQSEQH